jgi:hypothetical protein
MNDALAAVGQALPRWLVEMTVTTGLLLAAALAVDRLLERRVSAALRLFLYLPILLRPVLPVDWTTPLGVWPSLSIAAPRRDGGDGPPRPAVSTEPGRRTVAARSPLDLSGSGVRLAATVYPLGVLLLLGLWGVRRVKLGRRLLEARPGGHFHGHAILVHPTLGPFTCGVVRPRIVLPAALLADGAAGDGLDSVLAHEAAHLERGDQRLLTLVQLGCMAGWPLLPLWLAAARIRTLAELAADERALQGHSPEQRRRYGELLLAMTDSPQPGPAFGSALRARLRALGHRRRWPAALQAPLVTVAAALLLACTGRAAPERASPPAPMAARAGSPLGLREVVQAHHVEVQECYQRWLTQPSRQSRSLRTVMKVEIGRAGKVARASVVSGPEAAPASCLLAKVQRWRFPAPEGGSAVAAFPVVFSDAR